MRDLSLPSLPLIGRPRWTPALFTGVCYLAGAMLGLAISRGTEGIAALWPANGILLSGLMLAAPGTRRPHVVLCCVASLFVNWWSGSSLIVSAVFTLANLATVATAYTLIRRWTSGIELFESANGVCRFLLATLVAVPLGATIAASAIAAGGGPFRAAWISWAASDLIGIVLIVSFSLTCARYRLARPYASASRSTFDIAVGLFAVLTTTLAIFSQTGLPVLFLPLAALVLATYRMGLLGAAAGTLVIALIGSTLTALGLGPIALINAGAALHILFFQGYLVTIYATCLPLALLLAERRRLSERLDESDRRHRRILDRSREVIFETDLEGRWIYLNPAWETLTGRTNEESIGRSFISTIHPADRDAAMARLASLLARDVDECRQELRYLTAGPDQTDRWASVRSHLLIDQSGNIVGTYGTLHDVTARRSAEQARLKSERLYQLLADNSNDMIVQFTMDGVRRYVSPASKNVLGYAPEELVDAAAAKEIHPDDRGTVIATCRTLLNGAVNPICTYRQRHKNGHYIWLEASYRLLHDTSSNKPTGFIASVRDVGRRRQAELDRSRSTAELQETNRLLTMAEAMGRVGHWRVDCASQSVFWSDVVCEIHGQPAGHAPAFATALAVYHPDDRADVELKVSDALENGTPYEFHARLLRPDRQVRHVIARGRAEQGPDGAVIGLFGVIQDVTEQAGIEALLRDREARFRLITEQAGDIISLHATDGAYRFISPAVRAVLGHDPDEMLGKTLEMFISEEDIPLLAPHRAQLHIEAPGAVTTLRFRMRHADGHHIWVEAAARLADYMGDTCTILVCRDISDQVVAEVELREARALAEAAARAKANFLANMSHEIRTPMNGVIGFTDLLLSSDLRADQRRQAELIADSGRAMMRLLNDILDLSKVEAGQMTVAEEPVDLPHALRACVTLVMPAAAQKHIALDYDFAENLPKMVVGDGLRLRQIVLNLLGNAVKFTEHGRVTLRASIQPGGTPSIVIEVEDTGIGIAPDRQAAVFEQFVQAETGTASKFGGTGLGLAISAQLARLMNGKLTLTSVLGEGTRFFLSLPLRTCEASASTPVSTSDGNVEDACAELRPGLRILVAEDHDVNQLLMRSMLERLGCDVDIAENGHVAVERVQHAVAVTRPYAMVLMDMQMPELDGIGAARRIRASGITATDLPIVALTANAYADDIAACLDAGMQAHLAKPMHLDGLQSALARWTDMRQPHAALNIKSRFSPKIEGRYRQRKAEIMAMLTDLLRADTYTDTEMLAAVDLHHKLAGTAAMFGDEVLGHEAQRFDVEAMTWDDDDRRAHVTQHVAAMRAAIEIDNPRNAVVGRN
ncbi:PAS domain S-box protein [Sphingomonas sp. PB2P12]|uniref:PAS domain S-box protein n=1 Tax=Sphingomonas sandaracina TaxID=3096157 RepID=UPI002FCB8737